MVQLDLFEEVKACTKCGQIKPLRAFYLDKKGKLGRRSWCKRCYNKRTKRYYKKNKRLYKTLNKQWYDSNKERRRLAVQQWREDNPERKRLLSRQWHQKNPEAVLAKAHRRRARKKAANQDGSVTPEFLAELRSSGQCAYCLGPIEGNGHIDHVIPLALGGSHTAHNLVLACERCNLSKGAKHPDDWGWPKSP